MAGQSLREITKAQNLLNNTKNKKFVENHDRQCREGTRHIDEEYVFCAETLYTFFASNNVL